MEEKLIRKANIFKNLDKAISFGVDVPKGIMIVGMPGCGKSLTAKATADLFEIPLVRLDVGRLLGKYVGESEENMRKALKLSEAISPCVLWIDELEKAFAGVGCDGGGSDVTTRLFGQFLTWMQEKENTVFIVATANDISKMPAEFLRKGRFDELFFVDLPNGEERRKILDIHLKKRNKWNKGIDSIALIKETEGFNGADLEAVVKDTIELAFLDGKDSITTEDLIETVHNTKSISCTLKGIGIFSTNPTMSPLLRLNPFSFPEGIHILEHLDRLVEIFNACWPMYAAMPAVLKSAVEKSYEEAGWDLLKSINKYNRNLYPDFLDVARNIKTVIDKSEYDAENKGAYKGALLTRFCLFQ